MRWSAINPILKLTGDPELAFSNAFARAVAADASAHVSLQRHPRGGALDHRRALRRLARRVPSGDRRRAHEPLRRARHHRRRAASRADREQVPGVRPPSATADRGLPRELTATCRRASCRRSRGRRGSAGAASGYALASAAPPQLMTLSSGRWAPLWSPLGTVQVRPLGPPQPLGIAPDRQRPRRDPQRPRRAGARGALPGLARPPRRRRRSPRRSAGATSSPSSGEVDLTNYLPFLALTP